MAEVQTSARRPAAAQLAAIEAALRAAGETAATAASALEVVSDPHERELVNTLLRHARGVKVAAAAWRTLVESRS